MAEREALRAKHIAQSEFRGEPCEEGEEDVCHYCDDEWPCDAASLLALLDGAIEALEQLVRPATVDDPDGCGSPIRVMASQQRVNEIAQRALAQLRGDTEGTK